MDRRQLLALAPSLTILTATPAEACSYALLSPMESARRSRVVTTLFRHWWDRDRAAFRQSFTDMVRSDGTPIPADEAKELVQLPPVPENTYALFDRFFTDKGKFQRIQWMLSNPAGLIVACAEFTPTKGSDRSCQPLPHLHLFLVEMVGLNPRALIHIATTATPQPGVVNLSMGDQRY